METQGQFHVRVYDQLKSARGPLEAYWQDLTYYCMPRKAYITRVKNIGDRLPVDIYDSTAIMANAYFGAGMQAYISSAQSKWFGLVIKNRAYMTKQSVLDYLRDVEDVLYGMINNSNFYQEDVDGYQSLGVIGTDVLYCEDDPLEDIRFDCISIEDVVVACDARGRVNRAYLAYEFDAAQALGKFGVAAGKKAEECYAKGDYATKFAYIFCVFPRDVYDQGKRDSKNMPFASLWIDKTRKEIVKESGYREFPFFVSRFAKAKLDAYGYSPAMNVLPDIMMLNQMEYTNILGAQNAVLPPLEIPDEAFLKPYNFNPGGKNIKNAGFPNEHITPIMTGANVPLGLDYVKYKQNNISRAFYNDLFIMLEQIGKDMTAFEVNVRNNQRMQMLGSACGNIMREKLGPVITRVYSIASRIKGKLPKLPPELRGQEYEIVYLSPLARAQKALELNNIQQAMAIIGQFAQAQIAAGMPADILDKINFEEAVDSVADITNIAPAIIRDDAEVEAIRANRQQQQQAAAQLAMMQQGAEAVKTGAEADKAMNESQMAGVK